MLNNYHQFSYGESRYIVLKELDTYGPIGQILLRDDNQMADKIMKMGQTIDKLNAPEIHPDQKLDLMSIPQDFFDMIVRLSQSAPYLILTHSELNWNEFLSAWICFIHSYTEGITQNINAIVAQKPEDREGFDFSLKRCKDIESSLSPIYTLIQIGMGYTELIKVTDELLRKYDGWRDSEPAAIRLSEAYLESLGFLNKHKGE